jgi:hypothetical protein
MKEYYNMKRGLVLDFETMGTKTQDCAVIDCSYFVFDTEKMISSTPYTQFSIKDMKKFKFSVKEQVDKYGSKVYSDTIKFWQEQSKEVRDMIKPLSTDRSVSDFTSELISYMSKQGKIDYWWSRSNAFDPIILWRLFESQNKTHVINEYLPHWKVRDTRTFIDAKLDFPKINGFIPINNHEAWEAKFKQHDSSWDILADILRIQAILRAEKDLKLI